MGTFGERLQREREMRGITLEEIAEATKIGTRSLRALEEQDFDKLPGGIFNKGFVRAYSKYLGIDEDQAVADYVTAVGEAQASGKLKIPDTAKAAAEEDESSTSEPIRVPWAALIIVALVVVVGFAAKSYYSNHALAKLRRQASPSAPPVVQAQQPVQQSAQAPPVESQTSQSSPPATAQPAATQQTAATSADGFVVKVRAKEDSWVQISADGKHVLSELLKANTDRVVRAEKEVVLVTGNAGGVELSRNDQILPSIGESGTKKTVTITAQDVRQ